MFAEGESELRGLVVQNLESCGFLNKIKAELRAGVFLALSEEGNLKNKVPSFNKQLDNFTNTNDGKLALSIVREFLEYFNLNFTLSVFDPEVSSSYPYTSRKNLCEDLNLNETELDGPILSALFKTQSTTKFSDLNLNKNEEAKKAQDLIDESYDNNKFNEKSALNSFQSSDKLTTEFFDEKNETNKDKSADISSFSVDKSNKKFFNFSKLDEKDVFKDQSIDNFFDDPVPSEKPNILNLSSVSGLNEQKPLSFTHLMSDKEILNNQKKVTSTFLTTEKGSISAISDQKTAFLTSEKENANVLKKISPISLSSEKGSLSSLSDLPFLSKQDKCQDKESLATVLDSDILPSDTLKEELAKKDPESTEEFSDRQNNSEESIEEEIEEEFSAGLDDLLNSSLSLGDDATSDQTVSQASVVDGVDHFENTLN